MGVIDSVIADKKKLKYSFSVGPSQEIIVDFYNIYCNFINFDKYKQFTSKSFEKCLNIVLKSGFNQNFFIVSKPIFEVEQSIIEKYTSIYKNLVYIIVQDDHEEKSLNRERDDFVCLMLNFLKNESFVITNDKFMNYNSILKTIKPFTIKTIYNGIITETSYNQADIEETINKMKSTNFKFKRRQFKFTKN